ncbi:MAG: outer membrane protein assembly factor BamA [Pseudomonadota bacterium]
MRSGLLKGMLLFLALAGPASLWAAEATPPIKAISIQGNKRIEQDAIRNILRMKPGSPYSGARLRDDVQAIYRMGYFTDVRAYFDETTGTLTFFVAEKTMLTKVEFEGNDKIDKEDLGKEVTTRQFTYLDPNRIREDLDRIRKLYDKKGFYLADVASEIGKRPNNEAVLKFKIKEGKKVLIERISFIGNSIFNDSELKSTMRTKEKGFFSFLNDSGAFQEDLLAQDRQLLRDYYGHKGYIKAKIGAPRVQLTPDKRRLTLTFSVEEGELYKVSKVGLDGEFIKDPSELRKAVKLEEGEVVDTFVIQEDLQKLTTIYADEGYAYANVIPRDEYDDTNKTVSITYMLAPGQKVYVERIEFKGNESTRDKVLRREMQISEGELYSATKLRESRQNIERLALFENVRMSTPRGSADDRVNVIVEIKEKPTGTFSIGAGFNTLESFQIMGRVEKRNLFGYGVDVVLDAWIGGKTQAFNLQYRDEYFLDSKFGLTVNLFRISRAYSNFDNTSTGGNVGLDYPFYVKGLRRVRGGLTYSLANESLSNMVPTVAPLFSGGITSSLTARANYDTRNRVFEPSKGTFLEVTEEAAGRWLGGDNDYAKTEFDGRWFFPVNDESTAFFIGGAVYAFHLSAGYVAPLRDNQRVPLFERYFPGGILSLRGFPIRSMGPTIPIADVFDSVGLITDDFRYGGNKQVIFNAEYVFPIIRVANIKGVFFFDMGNAFDNGQTLFTLTGQRQSVGFGLRWFSPIGPLRFEWGFPLDKKKDESRVAFDFMIGSLF